LLSIPAVPYASGVRYVPRLGACAEPAAPSAAGYVACRWLADGTDGTGTELTKGGIDILRVAGDRIGEVWSVTGSRLFGPAG